MVGRRAVSARNAAGRELVVAVVSGERVEPVTAGLPLARWLAFVTRSALFTLLIVGIGEETGWRGWLLPELQKRFSPLISSLLLGVAWGLWHFPRFAILFTWLFNRTGNLLLCILLHTAINNSQRLLPTTSMFPLLLTCTIVAVIFTDRMWRRRGE